MEKQSISSTRLRLVEAFAEPTDRRVAGRSEHDLVERLVFSALALIYGVDDESGVTSETDDGAEHDDKGTPLVDDDRRDIVG